MLQSAKKGLYLALAIASYCTEETLPTYQYTKRCQIDDVRTTDYLARVRKRAVIWITKIRDTKEFAKDNLRPNAVGSSNWTSG